MAEVKLIKCPTCGETKSIDNKDHFHCNVCGTNFFEITSSTDIQAFNEAQNSLALYDFVKADQLYKNIYMATNNDKTKAMSLFGRILAYFGINYIKDFNGNMIITFSKYSSKFKSIKDITTYETLKKNPYFHLYEKSIGELDKEYKRIGTELKKNLEYDAFICTKISLRSYSDPNNNGRTEDSNIAKMLHDELTRRGLNVFYSDVDLSGVQYDSQIYSALERSKSIIVISTKKEYLESPWVQSEWQRWLSFINEGLKGENSLYWYVPAGFEFEPPGSLKTTQIIRDSLDLIQKIMDSEVSQFAVYEDKDKYSEAMVCITMNDLKTAESLFKEIIHEDYTDYRPWLGLVDVLIAKGVSAEDKFYKKYLNQALELCQDQNKKQEILSKYEEYLSYEYDALVLGPISKNPKSQKDSNNAKKPKPKTENPILKEGNLNSEYQKVLKDHMQAEYEVLNNEIVFKPSDRLITKTGVTKLEALAEQNHTLSQVLLIKYYLLSKSKDYSKVLKWATKCQEKDVKEGYWGLGELYLKGKKVKKDVDKAVNLLTKAANKGCTHAKMTLGKMYFYGDNVVQNYKEAQRMFFNCTKKTNGEAEYYIGLILINGLGIEKNVNMGITSLSLAAESYYEEALVLLGRYYYEGQYVKQDFNKAKELLLIPASYGNKEAKYIRSLININSEYDFERKESEKFLIKSGDVAKKNNIKVPKMITDLQRMSSDSKSRKIKSVISTILILVLQAGLLVLFEHFGWMWHLLLVEPVFIILSKSICTRLKINKRAFKKIIEPILLSILIIAYGMLFSNITIILPVLLVIINVLILVGYENESFHNVIIMLVLIVCAISLFLTTEWVKNIIENQTYLALGVYFLINLVLYGLSYLCWSDYDDYDSLTPIYSGVFHIGTVVALLVLNIIFMISFGIHFIFMILFGVVAVLGVVGSIKVYINR